MSGVSLLQTAAMLALVAAYIGLMVRLLRPGAKAAAKRDAEIPFRDGEGRGPSKSDTP
jgi:cbb3-type cytochrome oxidase subunit 3